MYEPKAKSGAFVRSGQCGDGRNTSLLSRMTSTYTRSSMRDWSLVLIIIRLKYGIVLSVCRTYYLIAKKNVNFDVVAVKRICSNKTQIMLLSLQTKINVMETINCMHR